MWLETCVLVLASLVCLVYYKLVTLSYYWESRGVYHVKPWDRFVKVFLSLKSFTESTLDAYKEYKSQRYVGTYQLIYPSLFICDIDLIKQITVRDFEYFPDHLGLTSLKCDPILASNLFLLKGEKWKYMRRTIGPAFSSGKIKAMFGMMLEVAEHFTQHFLDMEEDVIEFNVKNAMSRYAVDVIGSCGFGINCNSMKDEHNELYDTWRDVSEYSPLVSLRILLGATFPKICEFFNYPSISPFIANYFYKLVKETIALREEKGIVRPDIVHLLLEARKGTLEFEKGNGENEGFASTTEYSIDSNASGKMELDDIVLTAQVLIFFFAGFDSPASAMSFMFHELAMTPKIQKKLLNEIDETLKKSGGAVLYEDILNMKYLDQVVSETLRRYPSGYFINRECAKPYVIQPKTPDEKPVTLDKGCLIGIPIYGIHMDPKYYPNPELFDPERFSNENKSRIVSGSYIPFGAGPRNCIGARFALLEMKILTVKLLSLFEVVTVPKTRVKLRFSKTLNTGVKDPMWLGLKKR